MANWSFSPAYRLYLKKGDGSVWSLRTLQSAQALLVTGAGVNQATFVLGDPAGFIRKTVQPRPMNTIELWSTNRLGESGVCWSGFVDEAHRAFDPDQGENVTLSCTGGVKLFEITRQTAGDVASLALAYAQNITGSAVLKFAARACGFPASLLTIHPKADSGSGYQQIGAGVFTNPDQQPWSAVVSAIQANSGIEWFFNERSFCIWRGLNYVDPWFPPDKTRPAKLRPRTIAEEDILQADFSESDAGVVTDVEVRYAGGGGFVQTAVHAPRSQGSGGGPESAAHKQMVAHLRTRRLVVYAPWIYNSSAAQYLADVLFNQYSAGVAQASVTIPADPLVTIGSLVDVPALGIGGTTRYYVSSITYQLVWGGSWAMTCGLAYGRAPNQRFPYTGKVAWPSVTSDVRAGEATPRPIASLDASNPAWDTTPYTIVAQAGLGTTEAAINPTVYSTGSEIQIYSKPHSKGQSVGPSHHGDYTVVAPTNQAQSDTTIALLSTRVATGYVTIKAIAPAASRDTPDAPVQDVTSYDTTLTGTGDHPDGNVDPAGPLRRGSAPLHALQAAIALQDKPYIKRHAGLDGYDCSGLVAAVYAAINVDCGFLQDAWGSGKNGDKGPGYIYAFFKNLGATDVHPLAAVQGDLLFIRDVGNGDWASQDYFRHVAFAYGNGQNYGANSETLGLGFTTIAGFTSGTVPFNYALDLSTVTWGSR